MHVPKYKDCYSLGTNLNLFKKFFWTSLEHCKGMFGETLYSFPFQKATVVTFSLTFCLFFRKFCDKKLLLRIRAIKVRWLSENYCLIFFLIFVMFAVALQKTVFPTMVLQFCSCPTHPPKQMTIQQFPLKNNIYRFGTTKKSHTIIWKSNMVKKLVYMQFN